MPLARHDAKAGGLPYTVERGQIMVALMVPSDPRYGGPEPQFAKGHREDQEGLAEAAERECVEELGLDPQRVEHTLPWCEAEVQGGLGPYRLRIFPYRLGSSTDLGVPGAETAEIRWLDLEEALHTIRRCQRSLLAALAPTMRRELGPHSRLPIPA